MAFSCCRNSLCCLLGFLFCVGLAPRASSFDGVEVSAVYVRGGAVMADVSFVGAYPPQVEQNLRDGLAAGVTIEVQLWADRKGWIDDRVTSVKTEQLLKFESFRKKFTVFRTDADGRRSRLRYPDLPGILDSLFIIDGITLVEAARLDDDKTYFLNVTAEIRPVVLSDLRGVESWLSGEVKEMADPSGGGDDKPDLWHAILDAALELSGVKASRFQVRSADFRLKDLPLAHRD